MKSVFRAIACTALVLTAVVASPRVANAVSASGVDPTGDVTAGTSFDITSFAVDINASTVTATLGFAGAVPALSDPSWGHIFQSSNGTTRFVFVGLGPALGGTGFFLSADGLNVINRGGSIFGDSTICAGRSQSISGSTITMSAPASCLDYPGATAAVAVVTKGLDAHAGDYDVAIAPAYTGDFSDADVDWDTKVSPLHASLPGGYYELAADGGVFAFGDAPFYGSTGSLKLAAPVVAMSPQPAGNGYRFVATDGGVFAYGTANFAGSMGGKALNKPVVGMATTQSGNGYWLVGSDGGIFAFGDAQFYGSMGGTALNKPIVGMTPTADGKGYWLVASDGGIFAFGDAQFYGSAGSIKLSSPIVGMVPSTTGHGYLLAAKDGGVFAYGDSHFYGSGVDDFDNNVVGIGSNSGGYYLAGSDGSVFNYGTALDFGDIGRLNDSKSQTLNAPVVGLAVKP